MRQFVQVFLWNEPLGMMVTDSETHLGQFEFYTTFLEKGSELSPIRFPLEKFRFKPETFHFENAEELPAFLADILPGGYAKDLLRYALKGSQQTPETLSAQSYLSLLGNRGMGAFRFEPSGYPELNATESVDFDLMVKYARILYNKESVLSERRVRELLRSGLFTKGEWPKALVAINDFTGEVISGQGNIPEGYEGWIIKFDGVRNEHSEALTLEYDFFKKALECGIVMAPCRLLRDGHQFHLLCQRFDRVGNEKIHVQSFAALRDGVENSYEAVFKCMRQLRLPYPDTIQFYKRMIFNVLINNGKDRPEKVMFLCSRKGVWSLAPAFNLKPTPELSVHAMSIGGKVQDITKDDLLELGKKLNIKQAKSIYSICSDVLQK